MSDDIDGLIEKTHSKGKVLFPGRPEVVVLCGSTRFGEVFEEQNRRLTFEGKIVLSIGVLKHAPVDHHLGEALGPEVAAALDELHLRKIDLADRVLVLNVGRYIGESTAKEIRYAMSLYKTVDYLEPLR